MKARIAALALSLLLALASCAAPAGEEGVYQLYFASVAAHGPALLSEPYLGPEDPGPEDLMTALLSGPTMDGVFSPFPGGVTLRSWTLSDGALTVNLSEQYGGLTDVSLTLADYCIVLTLGQLEGVEAVEITVAGQSIPYRSHQLLRPDEVELSNVLPGG